MKRILLMVVASGVSLSSCQNDGDDRAKISGSEMKGVVPASPAGPQTPTPPLITPPSPPAPPSGGGVSTPDIPAPSTPTPPPPDPNPPAPPSPPAPPAPSPPGTPAPPPKAVSLEECTAQKKAWPAVVGQKQPTQCGDNLVDWCCTRQEVKARFPSLAQSLEAQFAKTGDTDQFVLYHCSVDPTGSPEKGPKYTFHFAKIVEPQVFYQPVHVYNVAAVTPTTPQSPCPTQVSTDALKKPPQLPAPDFVTVVKPIVEAKCGGTACHSAGTTLGVAADFTMAANLKKANQAFLFSMPPAQSGKTPLTGAELKALTDFMASP